MFCLRTAMTSSDNAVVNFPDWSELCGSACKESFVSRIELIPGKLLFLNFVTKISGQRNYGMDVSGVVLMMLSRTIKIFSPVASETKPAVSSIRASSYPSSFASILASMELM